MITSKMAPPSTIHTQGMPWVLTLRGVLGLAGPVALLLDVEVESAGALRPLSLWRVADAEPEVELCGDCADGVPVCCCAALPFWPLPADDDDWPVCASAIVPMSRQTATIAITVLVISFPPIWLTR